VNVRYNAENRRPSLTELSNAEYQLAMRQTRILSPRLSIKETPRAEKKGIKTQGEAFRTEGTHMVNRQIVLLQYIIWPHQCRC